MRLTPNFTAEELHVQGQCDRVVHNAYYLCEHILEPIRAQFQTPIHITSGFRPEAVNEQVHGVHSSEHLYEDDHAACDFTVPGIDLKHVFLWIRMLSHLPFRQVILEFQDFEPACIHISTRENGNDKREALVGATHNQSGYQVVESA